MRPGLKVRNENTGAEIGFNAVGQRKATRAGADLLRLVPALPDLLRKAPLISTEADQRARSDVRALHRYVAAAEVGGRRRDVMLIVRETKDGQFHYSLHRDRDFETGDRSVSSRPQGDALDQGVAPPALEGVPGDLDIAPLPAAHNVSAPRGDEPRFSVRDEAAPIPNLNRHIRDSIERALSSRFVNKAIEGFQDLSSGEALASGIGVAPRRSVRGPGRILCAQEALSWPVRRMDDGLQPPTPRPDR